MATSGKVRAPLSQSAVDNWCSANVPGYAAPSVIKQFTFGQSNPTYLLTAADGFQFVLRKKPSGKLVSKTAHAIEREFQVIDAVSKSGKIPVPKVYALCMDESIIGTPFYIMEFLKGRIFTDVRMPEIKSKSEREECWKDIVRVLAKLHKLRPEDVGLENYASRKPFYPRQIKSLTRVSQAQSEIKDLVTGEEVGEIPGFEFLVDWYSKNLPIGDKWDSGIVHGDFKCDNMIFHPTEPRVIGVLDWELSTLGHPLSDLANLLMPFYIPGDGKEAENPLLTALRDIPDAELPIPGAQELLKLYCQEVGRPYPLEKWTAACSFAFFRLSVITQGIAARSAVGQASSAQAKTYAVIFPQIGALAVETISRGEQSRL